MSKKETEQNQHEELKSVTDMPKAGKDTHKLQDELAEFKDKYIRVLAEFENARKRNERDKVEFIKYANEGLIVEFLGILDDLERTVQAAKTNHSDQDTLLKGIEMVVAGMKELLKRNDVQPIKAVGAKFDPHCHEILQLADSGEHEEGTVLEEFQKGYTLGDKVVRTAKVKVAKPKQAAAQTDDGSPAEKPEKQPPS